MDNKTKKKATLKANTYAKGSDPVASTKTSSSKFFDGIATSSGVSESMRITIDGSTDAIRDAMKDAKITTKQVHLILGYIDILGGTALVKEIDAYAVKAEGNATWGRNEFDLYNQTPSKVLRTYINAMQGIAKWECGTHATLKVVQVS